VFYDLDDNPTCKPLPHNPFKACVVPRPIGWISSVSADGVPNIAPYSFFNGVASDPPMVMYASNGYQPHGPKDTVSNIEQTCEFVVNVATWDLKDAMNETCAPVTPDINEFDLGGLTPVPGDKVKAPRIKESPIAMECVLVQTLDLPCTIPDSRNVLTIGRVVGLHIDESVLTDGMIDMDKLRPISRLGYLDYAQLGERFTMTRPGGGDKLAGNA
jgi:flavin reductase (DIM6/NTAB) family NADH-FMN oxidoreductase RutF